MEFYKKSLKTEEFCPTIYKKQIKGKLQTVVNNGFLDFARFTATQFQFYFPQKNLDVDLINRFVQNRSKKSDRAGVLHLVCTITFL